MRDGAYLRSIGVAGAGPTESRSIAALGFDVSDSLWVFDEGNRRVDVYGPDLSMTRTVPFEGRVRGVVAWPAGGMLVVSVVGGGPGDRTLRVDRIEGEDRVPVHRQTVGADPSEGLAVAADAEGVFLVDRRSHSLTRVDGAGEVTSLAEKAPGWWDLDPVEEELSTMMDVRPGVRSLAVREGEVWILSSAVRPPADAMSVLQDPELSPNQRMAAVNRWITNGIQVLDASTGEPLRTYRFEGAPVYFLDDRFAYRWEAADDESMVPLRLVVGRY